MSRVNVLWFRHGLRLHDNPALLEAASTPGKLLAVFIFDGKSAGTKNVGYNRMKFLLESLADLQSQLRHHGGNLFIFRGNPVDIFCSMNKELPIGKICFEYDCEPIWRERDDEVKKFCSQNGIECIEKVSHTLWDPNLIIKTNGGIPPLTYQMFLHTVKIIGKPPRPVPNVNWSKVEFQQLPRDLISALDFLPDIPRPDYFGIYRELSNVEHIVEWIGGEKQALIHLQYRLQVEGDAFRMGLYLPNQARPDILGPPTSLSAHLRFGCLSVRKFYWDVHDLFKDIQKHYGYMFPEGPHITGQLIWREYFYTMSVNNINYGSMKGNDICLNIPWSPPSTEQLDKWKYGQTGFPLIDAAMRQLLTEGWLHHILRNAVATFLTRGGLWISWEYGFEHFLRFLLDADWSVCAGNWMWVSSSAFEKLLDSSKCTCPTALAWRLDPQGEYVCRYVPELRNLPKQFIHEPWKTPIEIQKEFRCIIGVDYPMPMIDFNATSRKNCYAMKVLREKLISETHADHTPPHCRPSNDDEIRTFFWLAD